MDGVLNILKPPGMTSHDVVDFVRWAYGTHRVGHTGTLDPSAAGVLVVCVGRATRIAQFLSDADKSYRAELTLGVTTDTEDADGQVLAEADASHVSEADARAAVEALCDITEMAPPMHSAVREQGRKLYELARAGETVPRRPRPVQIRQAALVAMTPGPHGRVLFDVTCSKGTYVRSLCVAVGERLGCGAHMSFLVRTRVGTHRLSEAITLERITEADPAERGRFLLTMAEGLAGLPRVDLSEGEASRLCKGGSVARPASDLPDGQAGETEEPPEAGLVRGHGPDGTLLCVAQLEVSRAGVCLRPVRVLCT
jgi:tRNA pseudouridine55 synthase